MFHSSDKNKNKKTNEQVNQLNKPLQDCVLKKSLAENIATLKNLFKDVDVLIVRNFENNFNKELKFCITYCDGLVNSQIMNESIIKPLMLSHTQLSETDMIDGLLNHAVMINEIEKTNNLKKIVEAVTYGDTVLYVDGYDEAIILNTKGFQTRSIAEPDSEKNLSGPREGFNEAIVQNLSLIRRKVRTNELKMKYITLGRVTQTKACICYIDRLVNKNILNELFRRLDTIDIDGVLDTNYITELIKDSKWSPFRTTGYTQRPDVVIGKLLEGRIAIFLDGTPVVLTIPYLFIENFQSSEDYYLSHYYTSVSRILRIIGFFLTISVPGYYIALVGYHHEAIPTPLLLSFASEQKNVPLPAALEAFILLIAFDILKETGIRMPSNVGQALSIVGALVIGQAAVDARLVSAPMIIVVALTGITNLLIPKMNAPVIYIRFLVLILSSTMGILGFFIGICFTLNHILNLYSFGIPQITVNANLRSQELKDTFIRTPWTNMITRRKTIAQDTVRMKINNGGNHD